MRNKEKNRYGLMVLIFFFLITFQTLKDDLLCYNINTVRSYKSWWPKKAPVD